MPEIIISSGNPLIKQARALHQKKARDENGLFLVEGIFHVGEAFEAGWDLDTILYSAELLNSEFAGTLIKRAEQNGVLCQPVSAKAFVSMSGKENPQGIAAIIKQQNIQLTTLIVNQNSLFVAVLAPQDPGNIGAILRSADAVGASGVILLEGGADLYHPTAVRASMGAHFWQHCLRVGFSEFLEWSQQNDIQIIGTSARGSVEYRVLKLESKPIVLLLGSEQKGLSPEQLAVCHQLVRLPMRGRASSLNLAVAAGILLYQLIDILEKNE